MGDRHVIALGKMRIVGKESGLPVEADYAQIWEIEAGRMSSMRAYLSHADAERAAAEMETSEAGQAPMPRRDDIAKILLIGSGRS